MGEQGGDAGVLHHESEFGKAASNAATESQAFLVAPTSKQDFNTLGIDIVPVACLSLHDILFDFGSSFVNDSVKTILDELPPLRESHKNKRGDPPLLSIFGHADPVGDDEYNKLLSGRRALAIHSLLTHNVAKWKFLLDHPHPSGGDNWRADNVPAKMRRVTGSTTNNDNELIAGYMKVLCPFQLSPQDFLGRGADAGGKADFQGCSEFNPLLLLAKSEDDTLSKDARNDQNQPNRRVVVYLFRPGTKINPALWPCPRAAEPTAACRTRFFGPPNTGDQRRAAGAVRRKHVVVRIAGQNVLDTFACRFYARVCRLSPCEKPVISGLPLEITVFVDPDDDPEKIVLLVENSSGATVGKIPSAAATKVEDFLVWELDPADLPNPVRLSVQRDDDIEAIGSKAFDPFELRRALRDGDTDKADALLGLSDLELPPENPPTTEVFGRGNVDT
jgi:hypothetical protein